LAPALVLALLYAGATLTRSLPLYAAIAITASVIAAPLVTPIWVWGRRTR